MTTRLSDEILIAYVDGELPPEQVRDVEAQVATDAELAATVEALRAGSSVLRAAFNEPMRAPIPDDLTKLFDAAPAPVSKSPSWRWLSGPFAAPLAASVVALAVGLGGAFVFAEWQVERKIARLEALRSADRQMLAAAVSLALETHASGKQASWQNPDSGSTGTVEPVRTFRAASGQWCREYIQIADLATESFQLERRRAIACRDPDGQWQTRLEVAETDS